MTPTVEQLAIVDFMKTDTRNLLITALAGAAKTTTLELICRALPTTPILSLAFNKRIADEMAKRLPGNVKAQTLNSVGHRVWMHACAKRVTLETKKVQNAIKTLIERHPRERGDIGAMWNDIVVCVREARQLAYVPEPFRHLARDAMSREAFHASLDEEPEPALTAFVDEVLSICIEEAYLGLIDFDDQIYMPTLFGGAFPKYPLILVDETQDLSQINHLMLRRLVNSRLAAVGDPWQSIYGFRGAVQSGMQALKRDYNMVEMTLSTSFRCPISHVKRAWFRVPHMSWPDWAVEGEITVHSEWNAHTIEANSAIICRNNAPLFKLGFALLRESRSIKIVGADIGAGLVRVLKKFGPLTMSRDEVVQAIARWEAEHLRKSRAKAGVVDRADALRVFCDFGENLAQIVAHVEHIFAQEGTIQLLSGHKAKGLEWDTVYHLDPWRIPSAYSDDHEQELNVRYVIETRAKRALHLVDMEKFSAAG